MTPQNIWEKLCYENDNYLFELYEKYGKTRIYIKRTDKVMLGYITPDLKDEKLYNVSGIINNWLIVTGSKITYSEIKKIIKKLSIPGNAVQIKKIKPSISKKKIVKPEAAPPVQKTKQKIIKPKPAKEPSKTKAPPAIKKTKNKKPSISEVDKLKAEIEKIDKQIIGHKLHFLDRGKLLKKRKDIYVKLHMKTGKEDSKTNLYIKTCRIPAAPIKNAAKILSISKRTIQEDIQIIENLIPAAEEVIKNKVISKRETLLLIRKAPGEQVEIIEQLKNKKAETIKEAIKKLEGKKIKKTIIIETDEELYKKLEKVAESRG